MQRRWLALIAHAQKRWRLNVLPLPHILQWYRLTCDFSVPESLRPPSQRTIGMQNLPYCYPTVKRTCFDDFGNKK
eukprot:6791244-Pyramimonas_sp.AAC.1